MRTRVDKIKFMSVLQSLVIRSCRQCSKSVKGTGNSASKIAKALKVGRETKQPRTRGKPCPDKITEMSSLFFFHPLPFLALYHLLHFRFLHSCFLSGEFLSPFLSIAPSLSRRVASPRVDPISRENFRTKRKHFDFRRDDGGQRKLVDSR